MSAFIVDKAHIDAMLAAGFKHRGYGDLQWFAREYGSEGFDYTTDVRKLNHSTVDRAGAMLVDANVESVAFRYSPPGRERIYGEGWEDLATDLPGPCDRYYVEPYRITPSALLAAPTAVQALKLVDCYEYQSCEHDGWNESEAKRFCSALRARLIHALPGYDDAPWEWQAPAFA